MTTINESTELHQARRAAKLEQIQLGGFILALQANNRPINAETTKQHIDALNEALANLHEIKKHHGEKVPRDVPQVTFFKEPRCIYSCVTSRYDLGVFDCTCWCSGINHGMGEFNALRFLKGFEIMSEKPSHKRPDISALKHENIIKP